MEASLSKEEPLVCIYNALECVYASQEHDPLLINAILGASSMLTNFFSDSLTTLQVGKHILSVAQENSRTAFCLSKNAVDMTGVFDVPTNMLLEWVSSRL